MYRLSSVALGIALLAGCEGVIDRPIDPSQFSPLVDGGMPNIVETVSDASIIGEDLNHWSHDAQGDMPYLVQGNYDKITVGFPWANDNIPQAVFVEAAWTPVNSGAAARAMDLINSIAGEEVLSSVLTEDESDITVQLVTELPEGLGAWTTCDEGVPHCDVKSTELDTYAFRHISLDVAMWTHEFMHALGYYSVTGDVHDVGVMSPDITYFDITPRHRAYLEHLGHIVQQRQKFN